MSVSSFEGSPLPVDLQAKYEKLATEYAKVRSQVVILKKAVLDEQSRSSQLKEDVKSKNQTLRKHDQELDSLNFRNQQLTKRVTVLQEELDRIQSLGKKGRGKNDNVSAQDDITILQEELSKKISENAALSLRLAEVVAEHQRELDEWKSTAAEYKHELESLDLKNGACAEDSCISSLALLNHGEKQTNHIVNPHEVSHPSWDIIKPLPVVELLNSVDRFFLVCCEVTSQNRRISHDYLERFGHAWTKQRHLDVQQYFKAYLTSLKTTTADFFDRELKNVWEEVIQFLNDFLSALDACFKAHLSQGQLRSSVIAVGTISRTFRSSLQRHAIELKGSEADRYSSVLFRLSDVETCCGSVWKTASAVMVSAENDYRSSPLHASVNAQPCPDCSVHKQRIASLEEQISLITANMPVKNRHSVEESAMKIEESSIANELGSSAVLPNNAYSNDSLEETILSRVNGAIVERQVAESKLTTLLVEREAAMRRLEHCMEQLSHQTSLSSRLQEELTITTRNYEEQLSSMSEHMANMNDKLAAQETQIEELMFGLNTKDTRKSGRNK